MKDKQEMPNEIPQPFNGQVNSSSMVIRKKLKRIFLQSIRRELQALFKSDFDPQKPGAQFLDGALHVLGEL